MGKRFCFSLPLLDFEMKLADLLKEKKGIKVFGSTDVSVRGVTADSREVAPGYVFFAYPGQKVNGRSFISEAIKKGAKVIVTDSCPEKLLPNVSYCITPEVKKTLAIFTKTFYNKIDEKMKIIGITGTQGKTTVAYLLRHILLTAGYDSGLISTIKYYDGKDWMRAENTTPEIYKIFSILAGLYEKGIDYCVMEVSSHALSLERVFGLNFAAAGFTNLSAEHLDFHKNLEDYKLAKMKLFQNLTEESFAVYNLDDPMGVEIERTTKAKKISYAIKSMGSIRGKVGKITLSGMEFYLNTEDGERRGRTFLLGEMNLYNILCAYGLSRTLGIKGELIMKGIETFRGVKGRLERVENDRGFEVFIDYAHTPKALENLLQTVKPLAKRVILVFGCGGDRDRTKRPVMGKIATELADWVIITSDNPRSENPEEIIEEIIKGIERNNYEKVLNRREAIKRAIHLAKRGDAVIIAGKGHEEYQIIGNQQVKFSDRKEAELALRGK
uniref:UDP-N-acetylmuramoyl-L-alanyl-D-glutamate--2,6-diaminopimelate ligase n=1 Tax=candidate division WOR-3 bacterium TaxID=2052148 RepID=A0A7C3Z217_UNCW3